VLLCRVTARKQTSTKVFYGTDTGFNHLIRPALYGAHHNIVNLTPCTRVPELATICGNICECTDNLLANTMISANIGDILCIENAGAYGYAMSMNYN
jgi:diaminopimelate decarboxylase